VGGEPPPLPESPANAPSPDPRAPSPYHRCLSSGRRQPRGDRIWPPEANPPFMSPNPKTGDLDSEQPPPPPTSLCAWLPPHLAGPTQGTGSGPREPGRRRTLPSSPHNLRRYTALLQTRQAVALPWSQPRKAALHLRARVCAPRTPLPVAAPSWPLSAISAPTSSWPSWVSTSPPPSQRAARASRQPPLAAARGVRGACGGGG
jgi:hypothetical protein